MPTLQIKKVDKATRFRQIITGVILLVDILLLPWIIKFPFFLFQDAMKAPGLWFSYGIFRSIKDVWTVPFLRSVYLVLQIFVAALVIAVLWDVNRLRKKNRIKDGIGGPDPSGQGQHGTSRWQNVREMDVTAKIWHTSKPLKKGGIIFGMESTKDGDEKVWLDDDDSHTLIIAATRSGKSRKLYLPTIWEMAKSGESMIIGDPKGELYITSKEYLEKQGYNVIAINLREPSKGNQWNMLHLVNKAVDDGDIPKAAEIAWDIAHMVSHQTPSVSSEPIWENGEESTIAALILLTALNSEFKFQRHMTTAYYLLAEYGQPLDEDGVVPLLEYIKSLPVRHPAKSAFAIANVAPYKTRASFFTQALADLRLFGDPNIQDMTNKQDHDIEKIGIEKTAVFLIVPDEKSTRNVLATIYIDQVYQSLVDLANKNGGRIPRTVKILLDEFGNLPVIPNFEKKLTVAGGRGIHFTIAVQDVAQLKELYKQKQQTITGNCQNWIYLSTSDVETAELISKRTGQYTVETDSANSSIQSKGHSFGSGVSLTGRALLMPDEVARWTGEESLVLRAKQFPAKYPLPDLSQWKANKDLGFADPSGDLDRDKIMNSQIIMKRWEAIPNRNIEEVSIWLPEFDDEPEEEQEKTSPKKKGAAKNENVVLSHMLKQSSDGLKTDNKAHSLDDSTIEKVLDKASREYYGILEVAVANETASDDRKLDDETVDSAQPFDMNSMDLEDILKAESVKQEDLQEDDFL